MTLAARVGSVSSISRLSQEIGRRRIQDGASLSEISGFPLILQRRLGKKTFSAEISRNEFRVCLKAVTRNLLKGPPKIDFFTPVSFQIQLEMH